MSNSLGALVVTLGLDAASYIKGLTKAEYEAQKFAKSVESSIEAARASMLAFSVAAAGAAIVINNQLEKIAGYQDLAEKIGDTAEAVASLSTAANVSGVSLETVSAASVKLTSALADVDAESSSAGNAIKALGLDFVEFKKLSPVDQIETLANSFAKFEDGAGKTAAAVDLFGRSGAELLPFLSDLADGSERNIKLTQAQIEAADQYSKQVARLKSSLEGLTVLMATKSLPVMSDMVEQFQTISDYMKVTEDEFGLLDLAISAVNTAFEAAVLIFSDLNFIFKGIISEVSGLAEQFKALASGDFEGAMRIGDAMKVQAEKARAELEKFQAEFTNRTLQIKETAEKNKPNFDYTSKSGKEKNEAVKAQKQDLQDLSKELEKYNTWLEKIKANTESGRASALLENQLKINEAFQRGDLDARQYKEAIDELNKKTKETTGENDKLANSLGLTFSSAFEDAIIGGKGFSDILKGIEQDLLKLIVRLTVTEPLLNSIKAGISSSGFSLGSIFGGGSTANSGGYTDLSFAGGGYTGAGSRSGGLDGQGGFMAMLHPNETVVDHAMGQGLGGGGGAVTVNVINQGSQMQVTGQSSRQNSDGSTTIDVMIAAVESGLADRMGAGVGSLFQATNSRFVPQGAM